MNYRRTRPVAAIASTTTRSRQLSRQAQPQASPTQRSLENPRYASPPLTRRMYVSMIRRIGFERQPRPQQENEATSGE